MDFISKIQTQAQKTDKTIVLPEGLEPRILKAVPLIEQRNIADIILLGEEEEVRSRAEAEGVDLPAEIEIMNPEESDKLEEYGNKYYKLRQHKGISKQEAVEKMKDPLYFSSMMVKTGAADGKVAGAVNATAKVLGAAIRIIGTSDDVSVISGAFIMIVSKKEFGTDGVLLFADAGVNPNPDAGQLGEIAVSSARTFEDLVGEEPKVALLSFSTKGSADHELVDKVQEATAQAKELAPELVVDGEMQGDAALVPEVSEKKCPDSEIKGDANVLIFPDLQAGNIGYKLVQRLAGAEAFGPILQGIAAPVNDLSRGCSVEDIVNVTAITVAQADNR
jgi:phosphate acetyltransferase